jgi:acetylcholinesterase
MGHFDSAPPFHKAILESGATTARAVYPPDHAMHEEQFEAFIGELGLSAVPKDHLISKLREQDTFAIKNASEAVFLTYNPSIRWPFQPVIDGEGGIIPIRPIDAWRSGSWTKIPILTGFNTNEGAIFVPKNLSTSTDFTSFFRTLLPGLSDPDLAVLDDTYPDPLTHPDSKYCETRPGEPLGEQFKRAEQAYAQFAYVAPVRQTARYAAAEDGPPVYLYHFAVNSSVVGGANHGDQNGFATYDRAVRERSRSLREVSGSMHAYWTSFITRYVWLPLYLSGALFLFVLVCMSSGELTADDYL